MSKWFTEDELSVKTMADADRLLSIMRGIKNRQAKVIADRDKAAAKATETFAPELDSLAADYATLEAAVAPFAEERKATLPADKKSWKFDNGVIGWKAAAAKLELLNETKDWDTAQAKILLAVAGKEPFKHWIRTEPELAKDAILKDAKSGKADAATLRRFDLKLGGGEDVLYVKPKSDPTRDRETDAAEE